MSKKPGFYGFVTQLQPNIYLGYEHNQEKIGYQPKF